MKTILITGGTGFVGGHIIAELLQNSNNYFPNEEFKIISLSQSEKSVSKLNFILNPKGFSAKDVECIFMDLSDTDALQLIVDRADYVIHTAAVVELNGNEGEVIVQRNVSMTQSVVTACLNSERKPVLVHLSSIATLSTTTQSDIINEDMTFDNIQKASPYSRSKFLSENVVWLGVQMGLQAGIIMPSLIIGNAPKGEGIQPLISFARISYPLYFGGGTGFVDVRDVARAALSVALNPKAYSKRYIVSERNMTFKEFVMLYNYKGKTPFIKLPQILLYIGLFLIKAILIILGRKPKISYSMISMLKNVRRYDGTRIHDEIGFEYKYPLNKRES